ERLESFETNFKKWIDLITDYNIESLTSGELINKILGKDTIDKLKVDGFTEEAKQFVEIYKSLVYGTGNIRTEMKNFLNDQFIKLRIQVPIQKKQVTKEISDYKNADYYKKESIKNISNFEKFQIDFMKFMIINSGSKTLFSGKENYEQLSSLYEKRKGNKNVKDKLKK